MTVFVTGGTGRLGRVLVDKLLGRQEIRVLDQGNAILPDKVIGIKGDLSDTAALDKGMAGCDVVFHLAALLDYSAPWSRLEEVNIQGTRNVVEMCAKHKVRRLIFASSTAVYGKELKEQPANEETPTNPTDLYGKSKLEAERVVGEHFSDVPYTIFRPGVLYGPTYIDYYSKVFRALNKGEMRIFGDGKNIVPFVNAGDVADAMMRAAAYDSAKGKTYVLSGNKILTQEQIYIIAAQALGVEFKKQYMNPGMAKAMLAISSIFNKSSISQEDIDVLSSHRIFDITKAEADLKWAPTPLEFGIKEMAQLYKDKIIDAKKKRYLEYQRELLKQGKFVTNYEKPMPAEEVKGQLDLTTQTIPTQPVSKPRYFQPMPKINSEEEKVVPMPTAPTQRPVVQIQRPLTQKPATQVQNSVSTPVKEQAGTSFFGFPIGAPKKKEEQKQDSNQTSSVPGYSNAIDRMNPAISKSFGSQPPKIPDHVLAKIRAEDQRKQQGSQTPTQQAQRLNQQSAQSGAQQSQQPRPTQTPSKTVGSGKSWLDSVLKDIKKDSDQKDDTNK